MGWVNMISLKTIVMAWLEFELAGESIENDLKNLLLCPE